MIDSVTLQVYCQYLTEAHRIGVYYCSDNSWKEYEITWNNMPKFKDSATSVTTVENAMTWYNWTVTDDVKTSFKTAEKLTLVLKSEDFHEANARVSLYSRDHQCVFVRRYSPKLVINYTRPLWATLYQKIGYQLSNPTLDDEAATCPTPESGVTAQLLRL